MNESKVQEEAHTMPFAVVSTMIFLSVASLDLCPWCE